MEFIRTKFLALPNACAADNRVMNPDASLSTPGAKL